MMNQEQSTVAALCYQNETELDFAVLAEELAQALRDNPRVDCRISTQYDDFVVFDLVGVRICIAHCHMSKESRAEARLTRYSHCLVVSVGSIPGQIGEGALYDVRAEICRGLVERIEGRHPSDRYMMIELDKAFTEEVYDAVLENIWPLMDEDAEAAAPLDLSDALGTSADQSVLDDLAQVEADTATAQNAEHAHVFHSRHAPQGKPEDIFPDLEKRFEEELAHREATLLSRLDEDTFDEEKVLRSVRKIRPTHPAVHADRIIKPEPMPEPTLAPLSVVGLAEGDHELAARLRYALYPPEDELPDQIHARPLAHRAAIYTINASLIAISLPVGAAMMTYCILGRESLNVAARAMALTGTAIGFSQLGFAHQLITALV